MDAQLLKAIGGIAGVGGIALGVVLIVFREILRKGMFPKMSPQDSYRVVRLMIVVLWSVGIVGLCVWYWTQPTPKAGSSATTTTTTHGQGSPIIQGTGGNVDVTIGKEDKGRK